MNGLFFLLFGFGLIVGNFLSGIPVLIFAIPYGVFFIYTVYENRFYRKRNGDSDFLMMYRRAGKTRIPESPLTPAQWLAGVSGSNSMLPGTFSDATRVSEALRRQLTHCFAGVEEPPLRLLLLAMFARKGQGDEIFWMKTNALMNGADPENAEKTAHSVLKSISEQDMLHVKSFAEHLSAFHAFSETALMGMFRAVRVKNPVSTSEFGWLQHSDRALFLALDSVGRSNFFPESIGAAFHFLCETEAGHAIHDADISKVSECLLAYTAAANRNEL